ncbi:MAG: DUF6265 family protein [Caulobacteraceae bacterium]
MFKLTLPLAAAVVALAGPAAAQTNPISQLSWLAGMWRADAMGGKVEDVWTPATNGEMLSTFKALQAGDKVSRYEFRSIRMIDGKLTFQELGFGGDMKAANGPPLAPLTEIDGKHAVFGGFKFESTGPNTMTVTVTRPAPAEPLKILYTRAMKFAAP